MEMKVLWTFIVTLSLLTTTSKGENDDFSTTVSVTYFYTAADLREIRDQPCSKQKMMSAITTDMPKEMKRRKRGKAGGVRKRMRTRKYKPYLPSVIMGNVQSLNSKIDELCANVK